MVGVSVRPSRYASHQLGFDRPRHHRFLGTKSRTDYATKASWRWAIAREADDGLVGVCGFSTWSTVHRAAELVYDLSPGYWSRGIVTRSVQTVLAWGFSHARLNRVQAVVLPSNGSSIAVLNRCGFTKEGVLRQYRMVRGEPQDFLLYSRLGNQPEHSRRHT